MSAPLLRITGVTKTFGSVTALAGVDLEVAKPGIFGLVGPNGAGKTTLFSVLCGFLKADAGTVEVAGHRVTTATPPPSGLVSLLPQDARMMAHQPVGRQLVYLARLGGLDRMDATVEARRVLDAVGLPGAWDTAPDTLSHGMYKRVGIAQAFLGTPRLIVLDEPTAGLDPHAAKGVKALLRTLRGDCTVVVSSHNLAEIEDLCHAVAILHQGRIVRHESIESLVGAAQELIFRLASEPDEASVASLAAMPFVVSATWDLTSERLRIAFDTQQIQPDEASQKLVTALVERGMPFVEMQVGQTLEDRFIEETS